VKKQERKRREVSPEMLRRIERLMRRAWDYIGGDTLQMIAEADGRSYAKRDEVIEMVTDADRMRGQGDDEAAEFFYSLPYEQGDEIARKIFPAMRYC
jgi:hypothetical protein